MWIFTTDGFLSAVRDNLEPGNVLVRFRTRDHAERILLRAYPGSRGRRPEIQETPPPKDYRWKISMPSGRFNILLCNLSEELMQYDNFKDACHRKHPNDNLHHLHRVWGVMNSVQTDTLRGDLEERGQGANDWPGSAGRGPRKREPLRMHGVDDSGVNHPIQHDDETLGEFDLGQGMTDVAELVTWADRNGVSLDGPKKPCYCTNCHDDRTAVKHRKRWKCSTCGTPQPGL
jgi:hypothetical protein